MKLRSCSTIVTALLLAFGACHTPVPPALGPAQVPSNFTAPAARGAPVWPSPAWWTGFGSTEMSTLIAAAESTNLDLAAATARVLEAEAQAKTAGAVLLPSATASATAQRARSSQGGGPSGPSPVVANAFGLSLNASYQLDFFGGARANLRSAQELVLASRYAQQVVALSITANVADTYLGVLALRQRIAIAKENADAAKRVLANVEAKVRAGASSALDLAQQQTTLATIEAVIPALEEQEREARYSLAILLGRLPEGFDVQGSNLDSILTEQVAPGLPSELLRRRPDVAVAEANLASAHADIDAARAAYFPQIGLTGSGGYQSTALSALFTGGGFVWSAGASLVHTIFDGGARGGQLHLAEARQQELLANYRSSVLNAFSDVETQLGQTSSLADQERLRTAQTNAAAEAFRISELQYREGTVDLLNVLTAQQTLFSAQDQLVQIRLARLQANIGLYQALGGGWSEPSDLASQPIPAQSTPVEHGPPATAPPEPSPIPKTPGPGPESIPTVPQPPR